MASTLHAHTSHIMPTEEPRWSPHCRPQLSALKVLPSHCRPGHGLSSGLPEPEPLHLPKRLDARLGERCWKYQRFPPPCPADINSPTPTPPLLFPDIQLSIFETAGCPSRALRDRLLIFRDFPPFFPTPHLPFSTTAPAYSVFEIAETCVLVLSPTDDSSVRLMHLDGRCKQPRHLLDDIWL